MKTKQLFIVFVIILLATTLLLPQTKEEKYCDQYSGESSKNKLSENYNSCESDVRCKVNTDAITTKESDSSIMMFMCVPEDEVTQSNNNQKDQPLPK